MGTIWRILFGTSLLLIVVMGDNRALRSEPKLLDRFKKIQSTKSVTKKPMTILKSKLDKIKFGSKFQRAKSSKNVPTNRSKVKVPTDLTFNLNDLNLRKSLKIVKNCGPKNGTKQGLALLLIVNSAIDHLDARSAIRETWGKFALERSNTLLYFMLGSTNDPKTRAMVKQEDQTNGDILQGQFLDSYYNLTLKTVAMMGWIAERCPEIRYVLKVDDDVLLNMELVLDFIKIKPKFQRVIVGKLATRWRPHRDTRKKWYVPKKSFSQEMFPPFVTGPAYFFTGSTARPLFDLAIKDRNALYLEDVYMTGIVAERAGIQRLNNTLMLNAELAIDQCNYGISMTSHKHLPQTIRSLWRLVHSPLGDQKKCQIKSNKTKT